MMDLLSHVMGVFIFTAISILSPIVFILLVGIIVFGAAVLRWVVPCKNFAGKVLATGLIALLTATWLLLRLFYHQHTGSHEFIMALMENPRFVAQDGLLLAAWIALVHSLLVWPGYTRLPKSNPRAP